MIIPKGTKVLVKMATVDEMTKGGIYLPQGVRENILLAATRGTVVAVGGDAWKDTVMEEPYAVVGDEVIFAKYGGIVVKQNGEDYRILNDLDIFAIVKEDDEKENPKGEKRGN